MRPVALVLLLVLLAFAGCGSDTKTTTTAKAPVVTVSSGPHGRQVVAAVDAVAKKYGTNGIVYGVWQGEKPLAVGAVGKALPGVPARPDQHIRTGNTAEWFMAVLLMQFVDQGKVKLDDPIAKWYPHVPDADKVTLRNLVTSTSGYNDYVTTPAFDKPNTANPFRSWTPNELLAVAFSKPPLFAPGTSWAFSDTNFLLLGQILQRVGGQPLGRLYHDDIFAKLGMRETEAHPNALVPVPALHAYTTARGPFEDSTNWDATWVPGVSNVTSTVSDLGRWTRLQYSLLSAKSRKVATAPSLVGTGPLTKSGYYIFGTIAARGWWVSNPQLMGYTGAVGYMPAQKLSVVVFATNGPKTNPVASPATAAFLDITKALTPRNVPGLSVEPRGASGNQ